MHGWKDVLKVEYNDLHKYASKLRGFLLPRRLTRSAISWSQLFYSNNWLNVLVRKAKKEKIVWIILLKRCILTLFKNQLERSKAMCSLFFF